jgi:hypothetical protein
MEAALSDGVSSKDLQRAASSHDGAARDRRVAALRRQSHHLWLLLFCLKHCLDALDCCVDRRDAVDSSGEPVMARIEAARATAAEALPTLQEAERLLERREQDGPVGVMWGLAN